MIVSEIFCYGYLVAMFQITDNKQPSRSKEGRVIVLSMFEETRK